MQFCIYINTNTDKLQEGDKYRGKKTSKDDSKYFIKHKYENNKGIFILVKSSWIQYYE